MGLRCLLGHDFSEPRTERDREERGEEVVITISEVKECNRCGETRVVSENKEVTTVDQLLEESDSAASPSPSATTEGDDAAATEANDAHVAADAGHAADAEDGESLATGAQVQADADGAAEVEDGFDHPTADPDPDGVDPDVEEDAEILDADEHAPAGGGTAAEGADVATTDAPESGGRAHGEWPDADANRHDGDGDARPAEWPDADQEGQTGAAGESGADARHSPANGESEDVEFIGGADPTEEDAAANEARTDVVPDAKRAAEPGAAADPADEDVEFVDGDGPSEWPEQAGDDEGYDAELDDGDGDDDGVSVDENLTPQVDPEVASQEDVEFIEADADAAANGRPSTSEDTGSADGGAGTGGTDAGDGRTEPDDTGRARPAVDLQTTVNHVDTVYVCPECGNSEPVGASSMRAGDICPECKRGYIEERELQ